MVRIKLGMWRWLGMACGHGGGKEWPGDVEVVENGQGMWRR